MAEQYLRVGQITRPHGVKGAVRIAPLSDDPERFYQLTQAYLERDGAYLPVTVSEVQVGLDAVTLHVSGIDTREQAEQLRNLYLAVDRDHAVKLPEGRYFIADLIGCEVLSSGGARLGKLTEVLQYGAADVYVIKGERTLTVPAIKKLLLSVEVSAKRIVLDSGTLEEVGLFED